MSNTEQKVIEWAAEKGILEHSTPKDQFLKVSEEVGEIAECLAKGKSLEDLEHEIGGAMVTLILLAELVGTNASHCLDIEYAKIAKRTGEIKNGVFVKDGD